MRYYLYKILNIISLTGCFTHIKFRNLTKSGVILIKNRRLLLIRVLLKVILDFNESGINDMFQLLKCIPDRSGISVFECDEDILLSINFGKTIQGFEETQLMDIWEITGSTVHKTYRKICLLKERLG